MSWLNPDSLQVLSTNVASSAYGPMGQAYYNEVIYPAYQQYGTGAAQYLDPANNIFLRGVSAAPDWAASLQLPPWMLPPTNPYAAPTLAPGSYTAYVNPADQGNVMLQFGVPLYYTISSQLDASDMAPLLFSEPDYMPSDYQLTELPLDNLDYLSALLPLVYTPDSTFLPDSQPPSETQPSSQFQPSPFDSANPDSGNPSWGYDVGGVAVPNYTSPYGWGSPNDLISMLQGSNISAFVNSIEDPYTPPSEVAAPDAENYSGDNDSTTTSSTSSDDDQGSSNGGSVDDDGGDDGGDGGGGGGYMG
jgi:hypothetical protein